MAKIKYIFYSSKLILTSLKRKSSYISKISEKQIFPRLSDAPSVHFALRLLFDLSNFPSLLALMSTSFLFLVPFVMGALTIYFSPIEQTRKNAYTLLASYILLTLFALMTMILKREAWARWMMPTAIFMIFSSSL